MQKYFTLILCLLGFQLTSQSITVEGYTFQEGNRGYLSDVNLKIKDQNGKILAETKSDAEGYFKANIPDMPTLSVAARRSLYKLKELEVDRIQGEEKIFVKVEMSKEPGYLFEVTLAEKRESYDIPTNAITDARIEVYNNTERKPILEIESNEEPEFDIHFEKGNHYTILIRKPGYLSKRMEAFVNVEGCILCFEGVGQVRPGVVDNLTDENAAGVLLANVELEPIFTGKTLEIENIYYNLGKWKITSKARTQLENVILLLEDNPNLTIELGSHTDSRGKAEFNMDLSKKRAKSAVDYLLQNGNVGRSQIQSRGYGESIILNKCVDGVKCTEEEHAKNRRTELKILNIEAITNYKPLAQMKEEEFLEQEILNQEEIRLEEGQTLEDALNDKTSKEGGEESTPIEEEEKNETEVNESEDDLLSGAKKLEGYKIILLKTDTPIDKSHALAALNNLEIYLSKDGDIWYMAGGYASKEIAEKTAVDIFGEAFPDVEVVLFDNGEVKPHAE